MIIVYLRDEYDIERVEFAMRVITDSLFVRSLLLRNLSFHECSKFRGSSEIHMKDLIINTYFY